MSVALEDLQTLYAYLDRELSPDERSVFEVRLAAEPDLATILTEEQRFRQTLQDRAASIQAPSSLRAYVQEILELTPQPSAWQRFLRWLSTPQPIRPMVGFAYSLFLVVMLGSAIWWMRQPSLNANSFVEQLLIKEEMYFEGKALLDIVAPAPAITSWLKERVSEPVYIPSLGDGWQLVGARLDNFQQQHMVHLLYTNSDDQRTTLSTYTPQDTYFPAYAKIQIADQDFFVFDTSLHRVILWQTNSIGYALIGDSEIPAENFLHLAQLVRFEIEAIDNQ